MVIIKFFFYAIASILILVLVRQMTVGKSKIKNAYQR